MVLSIQIITSTAQDLHPGTIWLQPALLLCPLAFGGPLVSCRAYNSVGSLSQIAGLSVRAPACCFKARAMRCTWPWPACGQPRTAAAGLCAGSGRPLRRAQVAFICSGAAPRTDGCCAAQLHADDDSGARRLPHPRLYSLHPHPLIPGWCRPRQASRVGRVTAGQTGRHREPRWRAGWRLRDQLRRAGLHTRLAATGATCVCVGADLFALPAPAV